MRFWQSLLPSTVQWAGHWAGSRGFKETPHVNAHFWTLSPVARAHVRRSRAGAETGPAGALGRGNALGPLAGPASTRAGRAGAGVFGSHIPHVRLAGPRDRGGRGRPAKTSSDGSVVRG